MSFGHFQKSREAHRLSAGINLFIRTRPDEESLRELPISAPDSNLPSTSIQDARCAGFPEDHSQTEKGVGEITDSAVDSVEEAPRGRTPEPAGQDGEERRAFWMFKNVKPKRPFTLKAQIKYILRNNWWINPCISLSPVGFVLHYTHGKSKSSFAVNFAATFYTNYLGNLAMTEIGLRLGPLLADWMSMSTGNLIQFISCALLLRSHEYDVLQTSITGSILANTLFFLGISTFWGCYNRPYQNLNRTAAHMASNLLSLSSTSLLIPTASRLLNQVETRDLRRQSRGVAIVLIVVYLCFVLCEHWTHWDTFSQEVADVPTRSIRYNPFSYHGLSQAPAQDTTISNDVARDGEGVAAGPAAGQVRASHTSHPDDSAPFSKAGAGESVRDQNEPHLHLITAALLLAGSTALLYFHIDFAVKSMEALTKSTSLSKTFVGLVLFPLANVDYIPILLAGHGKLGQAVTQTVGKSIQTALLVMPCVVFLAWIWHLDEVTLVFDGFEVISLFAAVLLLNVLMVDAKLHWVQGVLLLADWTLIAIAAYFATPKKT
ncbi:calcium/proton exchanger [Metarhizium album ARSEF 1941]|uniref:Calcium/proton exchanger n=1 Tax=Metarhizium album (strain ARSEF 1941) TaxID=1081103 RepID=A0A0B2WSZ4_METAS|nr:calcium/proton exchanger [Metarhizium album ARSEF 1941]KHN96612.1 calcium/proton exchanger [Metarhizium album ARSEF 1941]